MHPLPESIDLYCRAAREYKASDLIFHQDSPPILRISGSMTPMDSAPVSGAELAEFRKACGVPGDALDYDTGVIAGDGTRFRVNFLRQMGREAAVLRRINSGAPDIDTLGVPSALMKDWGSRRSGIVIVSGPTGSGKSTTLAALLEWINANLERHVVTVEDPVEYVFERGKSLFTQRAVGLDTESFAEGLRRSLRQAPDVILVGEIRDHETASVALQAAETGHLVFTTLHASDAGEVLERMTAFFPEGERKGLQQVLAGQLLGILCQRLLPAADGGMVLCCEYLTNVGRFRQCIMEGDLPALRDHLAIADDSEARDALRSLQNLVREGRVSEETAMLAAANPAELRRRLRGISSSENEGAAGQP